jgi:hypothetical protein
MNQAAESNDDVVEEIQGHPQDGRQHVYIYCQRGDHYVCHEEISINEETDRVERATRWLIREVHVSILRDTVVDQFKIVAMHLWHCISLAGPCEDSKAP